MANNQLQDWQKVVIMATAPFYGDRKVSNAASCSVWAAKKYREQMKQQDGALDVDVAENAPVSPEGMQVLDEIVEDGLAEERGRI